MKGETSLDGNGLNGDPSRAPERPSRLRRALAAVAAFGAFASGLAAAGAASAQPAGPALPPSWAPLADAGVAPFHLVADGPSRERALGCLTSAIYYEAADQPRAGQAAVAQVVLNRVRHPSYPKSVCGVVYQGAGRPGCQFTFVCDGALGRPPDPAGWRVALDVAERALDGFVAVQVGASTHYHALWVRPGWSASLRPTLRIGGHQFYRMDGALGGAGALRIAYAGVEPDVSAWRTAITPASPTRMRAAPPPGGRPAAFSVWGLQVATVTPDPAGAVVVATPGAAAEAALGQRASTPEPGA